jgi:hypothetical protein
MSANLRAEPETSGIGCRNWAQTVEPLAPSGSCEILLAERTVVLALQPSVSASSDTAVRGLTA